MSLPCHFAAIAGNTDSASYAFSTCSKSTANSSVSGLCQNRALGFDTASATPSDKAMVSPMEVVA